MSSGKRFDDARIEAEWQAQERALQLERGDAPGDAGTARERSYRMLARALAEPPVRELPADFALAVARRARALDAEQEAREQRFERRLIVALWSLLAVAVAAAAVLYGGTLAATLPARRASPAGATWLVVLGGAIGLSWLWQQVQLRRVH